MLQIADMPIPQIIYEFSDYNPQIHYKFSDYNPQIHYKIGELACKRGQLSTLKLLSAANNI